MSVPAELIDSYLQGPDLLRAATADLSRDQLLARPVPGKWSTLEVIAHIADFEPILVDRMKRIIALDNPLLMGADERAFARELAYHERDLGEELALIDAARRHFARVLRALPESALARTGIHSERGTRTLKDILAGATQHIFHHLPFIHEKRKALGLNG